MKRQPQKKIKNPFTLRRRFIGKDGQPGEWENKGTGEFTDIATVQRSIMVLKANYPHKAMDIEFIHDGKFKDFKGNKIDGPIEYRR